MLVWACLLWTKPAGRSVHLDVTPVSRSRGVLVYDMLSETTQSALLAPQPSSYQANEHLYFGCFKQNEADGIRNTS